MIRTLLATAGVAIAAATFAAPAAHACLSCEYKPEVLGNSSTDYKPQKRARVDAVVKARKARAAKGYAEDRKAQSRKAAPKAAAAEDRGARSRNTASEKASTEKESVAAGSSTEPASTTSHSVYNTLIKTTEPVDKSSAASTETKAEPVAKVEPPTEPASSSKPKSSKTIDTADVSPSASEAVAEPATTAASPASGESATVATEKGSKETGCKKFFPMADLTLTVECK